MQFEWDGNKAERNLSKHKVSFEEAKLFLMIRSMLTFTIQTILKMRSVTLSLDSQAEDDY